MSKRVMTLLTLMVLTVSAYSQTPGDSKCSLTATNAPSVRGLRLGMSTDELLALFPNSTKRKNIKDALDKAKAATTTEPVYLVFDPVRDSVKEQFAGVDSVSAGLFKGKVVDFGLGYVGAQWTIGEWVAKLSESFALPAQSAWRAGPSENPNQVLMCNGMEIEAATQAGSATIRIRDTEALRGAGDRANAADQKRRQEMKP